MKTDQVLKYIVYSGIFVILLALPFIVSSSLFFPFITGKGFTFRIVTEVMLGAWALLAWRNVEYRPKFSWLLASITAFVGIMTLADVLGANPSKSIWSNYERMEGLVTLLHLFVYFIVTSAVLNTGKLWSRFFHISIVGSVFMGLYGVMQLMGKFEIHQGATRIDATLGNSAYLATYMLFNLFITLFFLLKHKGGDLVKWIYGVIILFQVFTIYHTATRGAILGLLSGLIVVSVLLIIFEKENKRLKKASVYLLATIVVFVGLFLSARDSSFVRNNQVLSRFASISLTETTTISRFLIWNMSWQGVKEHPILGWGQESFNYVFDKYYDPRMYNQEQWFDRSHNVFFDWLIAGGFLGLIAYLSIFACAIYCLWKRNNLSVVDRSVLTGLLSGYFFQNLFIFDNITSYILFFTILSFIYSSDMESDRSDIVIPKNKDEKGGDTAIYVALVLTLILIYTVNARGYLACRSLIGALSPHKEGISKNVEYFKKAISYNSFGNQEIREQFIQSAYKIAQSQNMSVEDKKAFVALALDEMGKQIASDPNNARLEVFIGSFIGKIGGYDASLSHLMKALELSPRKQSIYFEIGSNLLNRKEYDKALEVLRQAFELAPDYNMARNIYATSAIYAGEAKLAEELLTSAYGTDAVDDSNILRAYTDTGQYGKVLKIWEKKVESDPNNPQSHLSLAVAYVQMGQREKAIIEIRKVIELKPDFKEQGEYYIKEIRAGRNP